MNNITTGFANPVEAAVYLGVFLICNLVVWRYKRGLYAAFRRGKWEPFHWVSASIVLGFFTAGAHVGMWAVVRWAAVLGEEDLMFNVRDAALAFALPMRVSLGVAGLGHIFAAHCVSGTVKRMWWQTVGIVALCSGVYLWMTVG
jgi:hypothetical protein